MEMVTIEVRLPKEIYDDESDKLLDEFFELIEQIAPVAKNGVRALWLRAERGPNHRQSILMTR